ncbi:MAG TPA: hypothetical protein VL086_14685 [Candidatus Nitrosotalea sp.]|nr:hypothetical protein [Candidatus Nitrosotalea sp.]
MDNLILKLLVTPALIGAATLVGRRWGQSIGGWLVGLPLTTGPVAFFIALDHGAAFAAAAVVGSLVGAIAEAAFSVAYGRSAARGGWPRSLLVGSVAYAAVAAVLQGLVLGPLLLFGLVIVALIVALGLMPAGETAAVLAPPPPWDLPARMVLATAVVLVLTALAPRLGARVSGLLATYPLFAAILTAFGHRLQGAGAAVSVLRGLLFGLFSFAAFCLVLAVGLVPLGIAGAFAAAIAVALLVQGAALWRLRSPRIPGAP